MLTEDRKNLHIFQHFEIDYTLSKHQKQSFKVYRDYSESDKPDSLNMEMISSDNIEASPWISGSGSINSQNWHRVWDGIPFESPRYYSNNYEKYWFKTILGVKSLFIKGRGKASKFFKTVKESIDELNNIEEKKAYLDKVINSLRVAGQHNMLTIAIHQRNILDCEEVLKANNFPKFISSDNLITFILRCKKGLVLEYLKEFNRIIPEEVIKKKNLAEDLRIFDNYVILHYDPNTKKIDMVEKKDPIIFGIIKGSNKLYFIADWIDEKCDLTYEKIINELNIDEHLN